MHEREGISHKLLHDQSQTSSRITQRCVRSIKSEDAEHWSQNNWKKFLLNSIWISALVSQRWEKLFLQESSLLQTISPIVILMSFSFDEFHFACLYLEKKFCQKWASCRLSCVASFCRVYWCPGDVLQKTIEAVVSYSNIRNSISSVHDAQFVGQCFVCIFVLSDFRRSRCHFYRIFCQNFCSNF